jgi:hypothetical protein
MNMKNKKICVGMFFALVAFSQEMCAMNTARKVAQFAWNNKFGLVGTGLTVACGFEFENARSEQETLIKAGKITTAPGYARELVIFDNDKREIRDRCREAGLTVQFANMGFHEVRINMAAGSAGGQAFLLMSPRAMVAFMGRDKEFSREEMELILAHELVHVLDRHVEKGLAVESFLPVLNFSVSSGVYKMVSGCLNKFSGLRKPMGQAVAIAAAAGIVSAIKMNEQYISFAHRRSCERKADGAILNSGDRRKIETYRDYYKKMNHYDERQKRRNPTYFTDCDLPFYLRTNPTHKERIEACDKALAELQAAGK